jgi:uncharacterized protein
MTSKPNLAAGSLAIDLRGLTDGAHPFRLEAPGAALQFPGESGCAFRDAIVEGTLTRDDAKLRLNGVLSGVLESACDRCLTAFDRPVETGLDLWVIVGNDDRGEEAAGGDLDGEAPIRLPADAAALELADAVREAVLLEMPIKNLCREDCRGLCPRCGANRNAEPCDCESVSRDPRWGALREFTFPSDDQE